MREKSQMLLMKDYSATLINNLWGLHHCTHLPHHFTCSFEAVAPQSWCFFFFFFNHFCYLIQPIDSAGLNQRSIFSIPLVLISSRPSATNIRSDNLGLLRCAPTQDWKLHECTNPGRTVKLSQLPGCPDKQHMGWGGGGGGAAVLCADNRAGLHYLPCTVHW